MFSEPRGFGRVSKAEMLIFHVLGRYVAIERGFCTQEDELGVRRVIDLFIPPCRIFVEIDGAHHFDGARGDPADVVAGDTRKMYAAFKSHPGSVFVRIRDADVLGPLVDSVNPHLDVHKPFPVDWMTIIMSLCFKTPRTNTCVFLEAPGDASYDLHKAACGVPWQSIGDTGVLGVPPGLDHLMRGWRELLFVDSCERACADDEPDCGMFGEMTM